MPVQDTPARKTAVPPMKAVLISDTGEIQTLWLPAVPDGRYRFPWSANMPPFYVEAEGDAWVAHGEKGVTFSPDRSTVTLQDKLVVKLFYQGKKYVLYTEENRVGSDVFLPYYLEERADYMIGRDPSAHICYDNMTVSREHAQLHWQDNAWHIIDRGSTNGTYVNGYKVESKRLSNGDVIYILGLYILMGPGFIALNNSNGRVQINTPRIYRLQNNGQLEFAKCPDTVQASGLAAAKTKPYCARAHCH